MWVIKTRYVLLFVPAAALRHKSYHHRALCDHGSRGTERRHSLVDNKYRNPVIIIINGNPVIMIINTELRLY